MYDLRSLHRSIPSSFSISLLGLLGIFTFGITLGLSGGTNVAQAQRAELDHAKVVGATKCLECHKKTGEVWEGTHHFSTFREMPRNKDAREIAKKMGLKRIKADGICLDCHFTTQEVDGKREAIAGISCESCHNAGADWLKRHSEFSGKKKETESAEEAAARWAESEAAGMIRPNEMYDWAKNCYSCHVVPNEELVNKGGHPAGSAFELVAWSQGEVRHNLWYTETNDFASADRKRLMYVVGQAMELEVALRAVGKATQKKSYAVKMAKRAKAAAKRFAKIAGALNLPETDAIAKTGGGAKLKLNNAGPLTEAADVISEQTKAVLAKYNGSEMSAIDGLLPGESKFKGKPVR